MLMISATLIIHARSAKSKAFCEKEGTFFQKNRAFGKKKAPFFAFFRIADEKSGKRRGAALPPQKEKCPRRIAPGDDARINALADEIRNGDMDEMAAVRRGKRTL